MYRFKQPDRASVDEEKRAARNSVLKHVAFFMGWITVIKASMSYIVMNTPNIKMFFCHTTYSHLVKS